MTASSTVRTAYGLLDEQGLLDLQNSYDTRQLLVMVEGLDRLVGDWRREDGLRDAVLRLHGMAHTVINGALLAPSANRETLPELAWDIASDLREAVDTLQQWIRLLDPLEELQPRD
jgi:hypothetical protein